MRLSLRSFLITVRHAHVTGHEERRAGSDQSFTVAINPEHSDQVKAIGLHLRLFLDVPMGKNYLRIAVQDRTAMRVGSLEVPLAVQ